MAMPGDPVDTPMANTTEAEAQEDTEMGGVEAAEGKKLEPELFEAMQSLLEALYEHREKDGHDPSKAFHKRPNKRTFPDYYETIQEPMAISNLKTKIHRREYTDFRDFVRHLALIWHNALVYNRPEARAYVDATTIRTVMEGELRKLVDSGLVSEDAIAWPDLGEIPSADAEDDADDDVESGQEGEEDEEEAENSETEVNKPRRRARRPSVVKRSESQADAANTRRGRPPKVDTPLEARIKNVLKAIRKPKSSNGAPLVYHFEKLPDKNQLPDYYTAIRTPIALEQIKKSLKRKRYNSFEQCMSDLALMFENAKAYNEDDSDVFKAAVELKEIARKTAEEEKAKSDEDFAFEEGRKPKPGGITYNGKLWKVGDWVLIRNRNDVTKPIVAQIYRTWEDSSGRDWVNACWYYRPEQTVHHYEKHFWPNEVLKTSQYRDHPIEEVLDKCFVMFFTRFTRGRPRGLDPDTEVFVCEARYNEEKHKMNKIKTWSSCLPDEVRDKDYEMDLFETQKRIKKLPSPLEHKASDAKEDGTLPEPRMGADDAPPIEGGVYKGPRDDNQSPPPSPTPSPPPPPPVQPVRQISQTPGRETPIKPNRGNDLNSAMSNTARTFSSGQPGQSQTTFIQQRQSQASASPAPQQQYQQYAQNHASQSNYSSQFAGQGTPTAQRVNYASYRSDQAQSRQGTAGMATHQRPSDVMTLGPAANNAIPLEVREKLQTNDQGEVLFFPQPPQPELANSKIPGELQTSLRYRIERIRQRVAHRQHQEKTRAEDTTASTSDALVNGVSTKRSNADGDGDQLAAKKVRISEAQPWTTNPITLADIDLKDLVGSIDKIDQRRVNPIIELQYRQAWGVGYKDFLKSIYLRHQQLWKGLVPDEQLAAVLEQNIKGSAASIQRTLSADARRKVEEVGETKNDHFWKARAALNKQPEVYLEDRDPLYCGLSWTGPNPFPFTGGTGATKHCPKTLQAGGKENIPVSVKPTRLNGNAGSTERLFKAFKCPGAANSTRTSDKPARKRRKVDYGGADGDAEDGDRYTNDDRLALATRDVNKFPVFKAKDRDTIFRQRFAIPLCDKSSAKYDPSRPAPTLGLRRGATFVAKPLHDPSGEFAIVLYDPTVDDKPAEAVNEEVKTEGEKKPKLDEPMMHKSLAEILGIKKQVDGERPKVPVVIDPRLAKVLRPHQIEGVKFLYKCVTGMIDENAHGCIMADEMGLGKTLQCITLMWTLLKQAPEAGKSTIQKCVIACPSSLVRNWANELVKWLGADAVTPFAIDGKASKAELISQLRQWSIATGRAVVRPVLIVSYETLRMYTEELKNTPIGLLLCDEGHRLKNGDSQTFTALNSLNVDRRVILSGTPIQNDLTEYFSLLNFANPNLLGNRNDFRKRFEIPILKGRDAAGSDTARQKGDEAITDLLGIVNKFIIRRSNDILSKYLPLKYEHVVFCGLAPFQKDLYNHFIQSPDIKSLLRGKGSQPLKAIGMLKKLCNHPDLLDLTSDLPGSEEFWPDDYVPKEARGRDRDVKTWYSGKMAVLDRMLARIRQDTNDKIVLISNYTQTLDIFEKLCRARQYGCLRLDGTMNVSKRQKLVDKFNNPDGEEFVFLLSSKAGGCGLNLIGANRLVLFDPDWNPAADQQALARVWRDGQKKDCFVYRFIATGTIEEKIFQRQSHKQSLSSCVVDSAEDVERHFSLDSLRELFQFKPDTKSDTHDTYKCKRCRPDGSQFIKAAAMLYGDTSTWNHFVNDGDKGHLAKIQDLLLRQETSEQVVSAVFQYISH